jgi:AsmA protein
MKAVKYGAIALGGLIVLVLVLAGALLLFFDPNSYKDDLQAQVKKHTGRELALPGALKLSLFPSIALEFGPASLGNAAGFGNQPMVSVERVKLGVRLSPLLHKRVEVESVEVTRPVVALAVDAQGRDNWTDLTRTAESSADEPSDSSAVAISIDRLRIAAASISYRDAQKASQVTLSDFNLETGALGSGKAVPLETSFMLSTGPDISAAVKLKSNLSVDLENQRYVFAAPRFDLQLSGTSLPKSGVTVALQAASLGLDLKAQTLDLPQMQADALGARITASLKGASIVAAPTVSGPIEVGDVSLRELLPKLGIAVPTTKDPAVLKRLHLAGTLAATSKSLAIDRLKLQLDDSTATGSAGITDLDSMAMRFDLALDRINADRYLEPAPAGAAATAAVKKESPPVQVPTEMLRSLKLRGTLKVAEAVFAGVKFTAMQVGVDAAGGKVRVSPLQAQMYGGQYRGDINLDATGVPRVSFNDQVSGVDFALLGRDWLETRKISGRGNLQVKATAVGTDSAAMVKTLNGNLSLKVDNGAYEGIDLFYEIQRASALLKKQVPPARAAGPARTAFNTLSATGTIANGVVASNDITAATRVLKVTGKGTTDLPAGTLDYRLDAAVNKVPEASASAETADVVGFTIPVRITGSLSDPTVRPDLEALAKGVIKQKLDDKKKEVEQQLRDQLGEKLKGLFGQ